MTLTTMRESHRNCRLVSFRQPVFDCPQDVHASRVLGTPVAWSFAIRELPPGTDLKLPADVVDSLKAAVEGSADSAALEQALIERVHDHE